MSDKVPSKRLDLKIPENINRVNRKSYIVSIIIAFVFTFIGLLLDEFFYYGLGMNYANGMKNPMLIFTLLLSTAFLIQVGIFRLHDIDRSGWEILITFIPIAGLFVVIPMLFKKGNIVNNKYGPPVDGLYIYWVSKKSSAHSIEKKSKQYNNSYKDSKKTNILHQEQKQGKKDNKLYGKQKRYKLLLYIAISLFILGFFIYKPASDLTHYLVGEYISDESIKQIADGAGLSYRGKVIYYKANPELVNPNQLNQYCPNDNQNIVEYGCYNSAKNKIYILKVPYKDFEQIEYNVAAHETLHAIFSNLDYYDYLKIKDELKKQYASETAGMQSIKGALDNYEKDEEVVINELHSFVGASLATNETSIILNDYYSRYFESRNKAVYAEQLFNKKLDDWQSKLDQESASIDRDKERLDAYKIKWLDTIEGYIQSNIYYGDESRYYQNINAYENNRKQYNNLVDAYNNRLNKHNDSIMEYNNFLQSLKPGSELLQQKSQ